MPESHSEIRAEQLSDQFVEAVSAIFAGIFVFGEAFPAITRFFYSGDMGDVTMPALFGRPYGLVVLAVALMALGGFWGAGAVARIVGAKQAEN